MGNILSIFELLPNVFVFCAIEKFIWITEMLELLLRLDLALNQTPNQAQTDVKRPHTSPARLSGVSPESL